MQYPVVELLTAFLFVLTFAVLNPVTILEYILFVAYLGFWSALVALIAYDMRHTLIPLQFVYALWAFALGAVLVRSFAAGDTAPLFDAVLGMVCVGGFFAAISLITRGRGMGIGDAYVGGALGLMLGTASGIVAGVLAVWIGAAWGLCLIAVAHSLARIRLAHKSKRVTLKTEIPFAPFLALGAVLAFATGLMPLDLAFWVYPF
jgi:leader peptidase (prepilin peptidase) / N-methyltransferase